MSLGFLIERKSGRFRVFSLVLLNLLQIVVAFLTKLCVLDLQGGVLRLELLISCFARLRMPKKGSRCPIEKRPQQQAAPHRPND